MQAGIVALCALLLAILWGGIAFDLVNERAQRLAAAERENSRLARIFAEHVRRAIRTADLTLREVETEYARLGRRLDLARYAREREIHLDPYTTLNILDENGTVVMSTSPRSVGMNFRNNDNVRYHRENGDPALFISRPRRGAVSGKWSVFLSHRIDKADGSFAGNSSVALDPTYFSRFYAELELGRGAFVGLVGRDGISRARMQDGEMAAGRDLGGTSLFTHHLRAATIGRFREASMHGGLPSLFSYHALVAYPLVVVVSVPEETALGPFRDLQRTALVLGGSVSAVIAGLTLLILVQIGRRNRAEERLALAVKGNEDGIWDWNILTKEDYLSPRWKEMLGYRDDELPNVESSFFDLIHPEDRERVSEAVRRHLECGEPYQVEIRMQHKDGSHRWVLSRGEAVRDAAGIPVRMAGSITDITARKRAEDALRESEARFATTFHSNPVAMCIRRQRDDVILDVNVSFEKVLGYCRNEVIGKAAGDLPFYPDATTRELIIRHATPREPLCGRDVELRARTGEPVHVILTADYVTLGEEECSLTSFLDITARKRAEDALRESEMRLREAQALARLGNWELDLVSGKLRWSDEIYRIFEIDPAQFGASYEAFLNVIHPDDRALVDRAYTDSVADGTSYSVVHRLRMSDGRIKYVQERGQTYYGEDRKPLRSVGTVQDITAQKIAEAEIRSALAEKEVLLKEVYHRVKNNLQVVSSLLSIQGRMAKNDSTIRLFEESANRVKSLALVHEQLYRSRNLVDISFREYVQRLADHLMYAHQPLSRAVRVRAQVEDIQLDIGTAVPCGLILNELISNSYKHGYRADTARGEIAITIERLPEDRVKLRVADDGRGLPEGFDVRGSVSLGMQLVATLTDQLAGELSWGNDRGAWFETVFPPRARADERKLAGA